MFFSISKNKKENFNFHFQFDEFVISTDSGWKTIKVGEVSILYKGYTDYQPIEELIEKIVELDFPNYSGNFCVIIIDKDKIKIKTDVFRSFQITYNSNEVTNLVFLDKFLFADEIIEIEKNFRVNIKKFNNIGDFEKETLSKEQTIGKIDTLLTNKIKTFVNQTDKKIKIFLSGGTDTLLIYSYIKKFTNNYKIINCEHLDYDYFLNKNYNSVIKYYELYKQIHHWNNSNILVSGSGGDELLFRNKDIGNRFLKFYNNSVDKLLLTEKFKNCYHYEYYTAKNALNKNYKENIKNLHLLKIILCKDFNKSENKKRFHFHLGNTLTFTPLADIELFKIFLNADFETLLGQLMDSEISKILIEKNDKSLLKLLNNKRNCFNERSNLINL